MAFKDVYRRYADPRVSYRKECVDCDQKFIGNKEQTMQRKGARKWKAINL